MQTQIHSVEVGSHDPLVGENCFLEAYQREQTPQVIRHKQWKYGAPYPHLERYLFSPLFLPPGNGDSQQLVRSSGIHCPTHQVAMTKSLAVN